ncbi:unnamed protein product [Pedinophyceae sp. YPF-701]|nr:unnamed protein product [Pedinophyceae sp. YPF-701]
MTEASTKAKADILAGFALVLIGLLAAAIRLFSVVKYESVIHEFDPYFNYRAATFLSKNGLYEFWNWFDEFTWYPLGRVIGGTIYPGLTITASAAYWFLHAINMPVHIQEVCVFTAPVFAAFTAWAAYALVSEVRGKGPGLLAAVLISSVPSYISRSVAGSFDNEAVAIFALVYTFYLYVKAVNTGKLSWAVACTLSYFYMVMSWGGYSFIINLLPIHCLVCIATGRLTPRLYVAYAPVVMIGTILAASIPVVGFNAVLMSEHFGSFLAFAAIHGAMLLQYTQRVLPARAFVVARNLLITAGVAAGAVVGFLVAVYVSASPTLGWTGRSLSLLDPTYASKYIPIIASVSEHQPPQWSAYLQDIHINAMLAPAGIISCFLPLTDASLFLVLYGVTSVYFSGVMVRLMLVLAPASCCIAAVAASDAFNAFGKSIKGATLDFVYGPAMPTPDAAAAAPSSGPTPSKGAAGAKKDAKDAKRAKPKASNTSLVDSVKAMFSARAQLPADVSALGALFLVSTFLFYIVHCVWVGADHYSAPSIVLQSRSASGVYIFDDFREAYSWMRHNTKEEDKFASWWDYGYQTTAMANRTVLVDNNTWNNTHIATVGRAMASREPKAWEILRHHDVKYVFVVFGALVGYPSDDINKFLWMVRIGGGEFPEIKERDYLSASGSYSIGADVSDTMANSLMYKLSYYRFAEATQGRGYDRVRQTPIGVKDIELEYFREVFTSEHWMMRIYEVLPEPNLDKPESRSSSSGRLAYPDTS